MEKFDLEKAYQAFLKRVKLDESTMVERQKTETKRAFFGGLSEMFNLLTGDIADFPNELDSLKAIDRLFEQINNFWQSQIKKQDEPS